jgi:hypothetical protein
MKDLMRDQRMWMYEEVLNKMGTENQVMAENVRKMGEENRELGAEVRKMGEENLVLGEHMRKMAECLAMVRNTVNMLLTAQNGHTTMLESHRLLLLSQQQLSSRQSYIMVEPSPSPLLSPPPAPTPESINGHNIPQTPCKTSGLDLWPADMLNEFMVSLAATIHMHSPMLHFWPELEQSKATDEIQ